MLNPEQAWQAIESRLTARPTRHMARARAVGRSLAEDLVATVDMPHADVSAMDGYACAGEMPLGRAVPVVGTAAAGPPASFEVPPGQASKIMTGAVVPRGADRVVPVELTSPGDGEDSVVFERCGEAGAHIRRQGEVTRRGTPLLRRGALLTPGAVSLAASHGYGELSVVPPPAVSVIVTGDEVVPAETEPGPGELRDSNSAFLLAAGRTLGLDFQYLGIAPDRLDELRAMIERGLESEVLLLSGGVSMGEFDLVENVLAELGCEAIFDQVAIQPGKPLVAARGPGDRWVFGLPGNPASVMVTFWLFVRPLLRCLMGHTDAFWQGAIEAELAAPAPPSKGRDRFLPAQVRFDGGRLRVTPRPPHGSHDVVSYAQGTALLRLRPNSPPAGEGERCEILPLVDWIEPGA